MISNFKFHWIDLVLREGTVANDNQKHRQGKNIKKEKNNSMFDLDMLKYGLGVAKFLFSVVKFCKSAKKSKKK